MYIYIYINIYTQYMYIYTYIYIYTYFPFHTNLIRQGCLPKNRLEREAFSSRHTWLRILGDVWNYSGTTANQTKPEPRLFFLVCLILELRMGGREDIPTCFERVMTNLEVWDYTKGKVFLSTVEWTECGAFEESTDVLLCQTMFGPRISCSPSVVQRSRHSQSLPRSTTARLKIAQKQRKVWKTQFALKGSGIEKNRLEFFFTSALYTATWVQSFRNTHTPTRPHAHTPTPTLTPTPTHAHTGAHTRMPTGTCGQRRTKFH